MDQHSPVNRIAFVNPNGQLCTIAPDGGELRTLSDDGRFFQFPAWSPDSTHIAAIGGDRRTASLLLADDRPGSVRSVYHGEDGPPIYLYWTPDSRQVSFIVAEGGSFGLHLAGLDGSQHVRAHGQPFFWSFQPDSLALLAHMNGAGEHGTLRLLSLEGRHEDTVTGAPGLFQAPDIAAGNTFWAYAVSDEQSGGRMVVQQAYGPVAASIAYRGVVAFGWSPRENQLAFIHPFEQAPHWYGPLQVLDAESGEVRLMVDDEVLAFFWAPDGSAIAYLTLAPPRHAQPPTEIAANGENGNGYRTPKAAELQRLVFSIGVVDLADGRSRRLARFEPQPLFANQFLPFFDQYNRSHRLWSPDSQSLVVSLMARTSPQIAVVPRDGSRAQVLADGGMAFWSTR